MTDDEIIKISLLNCIVHLLEAARPGGRGLDYVVAQTALDNHITEAWLSTLDPVIMPLPRDGVKPLTFP